MDGKTLIYSSHADTSLIEQRRKANLVLKKHFRISSLFSYLRLKAQAEIKRVGVYKTKVMTDYLCFAIVIFNFSDSGDQCILHYVQTLAGTVPRDMSIFYI